MSIIPEPALQQRYLAALESQKPSQSNHRPVRPVHRQGLQEQELQSIEHALEKRLSACSLASPGSLKTSPPDIDLKLPRIKVKASAQSISIIIPEGVKLPIVATIETAGPIELGTEMFYFRSKRGSDQSSLPGSSSEPKLITRRNTISEETTTGGAQTRLGHSLLAKSRKGRLNPSEASVPPPKGSEVSAQGQIFVPPHESSDANPVEALHDYPEDKEKGPGETIEASEPSADLPNSGGSQDIAEVISDPAFAQVNSSDETTEAREAEIDGFDVTRPSPHLFTQPESAVEALSGPSARVDPSQPRSVPSISIRRPSGTVMATPVQSAVEQSLAGAGTAAAKASPSAAGAIPTPSIPLDLPLPDTGLVIGSKLTKRKKVIRKTRKVLIRKHLLAFLIGRNLANVVHPQLKQVAGLTDAVPLPVDGPSDMLTGYARRTERKRDIRRQKLDQRIAAARIHAEAEEMHRCRICRGLTRTMYLRRYHRLQLKRDRPDMSTFDRRATAMARVASFKCKCDRRLLGVKNEVVTQGSLPQNHVRAPAAIEPSLPGVDGSYKG